MHPDDQRRLCREEQDRLTREQANQPRPRREEDRREEESLKAWRERLQNEPFSHTAECRAEQDARSAVAWAGNTEQATDQRAHQILGRLRRTAAECDPDGPHRPWTAADQQAANDAYVAKEAREAREQLEQAERRRALEAQFQAQLNAPPTKKGKP